MKLLFDENISFRIIKHLATDFPESVHISTLAKNRITDRQIWSLANENGLTIVTYDEDFYELQQLNGFPPKVIWLRFGNRPTQFIAEILTKLKDTIQHQLNDPEIGTFEIH
ncbi:MAG: DUF5615 family PIN-like protein [Cyclobacteriaceae bacterium]